MYKEQASIDKCLLNAAATRAARGELSLIRLNYRDAADHFKTASEYVPSAYPNKREEYLNRSAGALKKQYDSANDQGLQ